MQKRMLRRLLVERHNLFLGLSQIVNKLMMLILKRITPIKILIRLMQIKREKNLNSRKEAIMQNMRRWVQIKIHIRSLRKKAVAF